MRNVPYYYLAVLFTIMLTACNPELPSETAGTDLGLKFANSSRTSCTSNNAKVGTAANFTSIAHGVSGTLTVKDDCTLEISNFNYDGGGPSVFFYGGVNSVYTGADSFAISKQIDGTAFVDNTLTLVLPASKTLDDFDSISVWCTVFLSNFGGVTF